MTEQKAPNYIGQWICPWMPYLGPQTFWMFETPESKQLQLGCVRKIAATLDDSLGHADVNGVAVNGAILFNKQYDLKHPNTSADAAPHPIIFMGEKGHRIGSLDVSAAYQGDFIMDILDSALVVSKGPFIMYEFDSARHPLPRQGQLPVFTRENMDEVIRLTGHEDDKGKVCTGIYSTSAILSGLSMFDRQIKYETARAKKEALIVEFLETHNLASLQAFCR